MDDTYLYDNLRSMPQRIPQELEGVALFPTINFRGFVLNGNFGNVPATKLPFQVHIFLITRIHHMHIFVLLLAVRAGRIELGLIKNNDEPRLAYIL